MDFTIVDGIVAVVIVISAILAYSRGFIREVMAILGWIAAGILALMFAPRAYPLVAQLPVVGDIINGNCEIGMVLAFAAVFAVVIIIVSLFTPLFSSVIQRSALGGIDQGLGFFFGAVRGVLLVAVLFLVYEQINIQEPTVDDSRSAEVFASIKDKMQEQSPDQVITWFETNYGKLVAGCAE